MNVEVTTPEGYKEKKWGKKEGGEYIVDGYTFKGRNILKRAKEGLSEFLTKGLLSEINGTKFKVLDNQIKGSGLEKDIQIWEKSERGIGILKLYSPNKKTKEYTIMVNKHKESDIKFVTVLAEKVVKPLMDKYITEEDIILEKKKSINEEKEFKCETCGNFFSSTEGPRANSRP